MRAQIVGFAQLTLIFPAALFMVSLVVRNFGPPQYEPAHTAQQIVMWYAEQLWTLWVLLFALPCMVLVSGCMALRAWNRDAGQNTAQASLPATPPHWLVRFVFVATVASAGILVIVALHVLTH